MFACVDVATNENEAYVIVHGRFEGVSTTKQFGKTKRAVRARMKYRGEPIAFRGDALIWRIKS